MYWCNKSQAACGLALLILCQLAHAGSFSVSPTRITLTQARSFGVLTVRNPGTEAMVVQLQTTVWRQEEGVDVLAPTTELIAVPPLFTVPAGGSQVVRIGLRRQPSPSGELSYRVLLREVPPPQAPGATGLRMALNVSLPVFVTPPGDAEPEMIWALDRTENGGLALSLRNEGRAHVQLKQLALKSSMGPQLQGIGRPTYLLPGQSRIWHFDAADPAGRWTLSADTDSGAVETQLIVEPNSIIEIALP